MKRINVLLLFFGFVFSMQPAQGRKTDELLKAEYCYSHMAFSDAIHYYEKIEGRADNVRICARLGDCYRLTNDLQQAAYWYEKAVGMEGCSDTAKLYYGRVLMQLARYEEAEKWLSKYQVDHPKDQSIANLIVGCRMSRETAHKGTEPLLLDVNTDGSDFGPVIWKGRLIFTSDTPPAGHKRKDRWTGRSYCKMYIAECDGQGQCNTSFGEMAAVKKIAGKHHTGPCSFTADGNTMYFTRTSGDAGSFKDKLSVQPQKGTAPLEIMIASGYDDAKQAFSSVESFTYNSKSYSVAHPAISPDGNLLVFCSDMPGGMGGTDLYICTRSRDGQWSKPQNLGNGINTAGDELFPGFTDNTTLYFSSDGHPGFGGQDIYECLFDRETRTFTAIKNIGAPFNSSYDDMSYAIAPSGVYFTSNRPALKKGDNLYFVKKKDSIAPSPATLPVAANQQSEAGEDKPVPGPKKTGIEEHQVPASNKSEKPAVTVKTGVVTDKKGSRPEKDPAKTVAGNSGKIVSAHTTNNGTKAPRQSGAGSVTSVSKHQQQEIHEVGPYKNIEVNKVFDIPGFYFGFNKTDIVSGAAAQLSDVYELLKENPTLMIQIQAYSDCRGTVAVNHRISLRRAYALKQYLVSRGVAPGRISCRGYGIEHPVVTCNPCNSCAEDQHQKNRRIAFKVVAF